MKKIRLFLYPLLGAFILTFIIGSFYDFQINDALFHNKDTFGLVISVLGTIPGYAMFAFIGGGALALAIHRDYKTWIKVIFYICVVICFGAATYFSGREFFGPNGFEGITHRWVGYFIVAPVNAGVVYLGYRLCRNSEQEYLWLFLLIMLLALIIALVPGVSLFKVIFHRPRFRSVQTVGLDYYPWYIRCADYKLYPDLEEEFKSFPSGHAACAMAFPAMAIFLPFIKKDYEKYVIPCYVVGLIWALLVMFCRMLVGAHYLTDVSMGAILTLALMAVALEVIKGTKKISI